MLREKGTFLILNFFFSFHNEFKKNINNTFKNHFDMIELLSFFDFSWTLLDKLALFLNAKAYEIFGLFRDKLMHAFYNAFVFLFGESNVS